MSYAILDTSLLSDDELLNAAKTGAIGAKAGLNLDNLPSVDSLLRESIEAQGKAREWVEQYRAVIIHCYAAEKVLHFVNPDAALVELRDSIWNSSLGVGA